MSLDNSLSAQARAKVEFCAYDVQQNFTRETRKIAGELGFASLETIVGDLSDFDKALPADKLFDFITLTNTVHEIEPHILAGLLANCIRRLKDTGTLFVYDMERVNPPELGAIPWSRDEVRRIIRRMLDALGAQAYRPEVGLWNHKSCDGWSVQLQRQHLNVSRQDAEAKFQTAVQTTSQEISQLLKQRLETCRASLETLTVCGAETAQEQLEKERLLFEFWALSRVKGGTK